MSPKHRRPTRTDRLLLWAKDRLTLRRRPQSAQTVDTISVFSWGEEGDPSYSATEYTAAVNTLADVRLQTAGGRDFQIWDMEVQA